MSLEKNLQNFLKKRHKVLKRKQIHLDPLVVAEIINNIGKEIIGEKFIIDKVKNEVFQHLVRYFTGNPLFTKKFPAYTIIHQEDGVKTKKLYDTGLNKGLLIMGNTGTGKTDTLRIFTDFAVFTNTGVNIKKVSCKVIGEKFVVDGYSIINRYYKSIPYFFDDLGEEKCISAHYSNKENVMAAILTQRYNLWREKGVLTFATTNLNADMMLNTYGERVFERICEMFNIFKMVGVSHRYKKA